MTIHVACQTNSRFAPDCAVMLHSLLSERSAEGLAVHFLHDDALPEADLARLAGTVLEGGGQWLPHLVGQELVAGFPVLERYGGVTAWFRLLLPRLLPDLDRILYLDADLMIVGSLAALWETDLEGRCLAAVTNPLLGADRRRVVSDLGLPDPGRYFNSGVMLMDLERLRQTGLMGRAEEIARARSVPTPWADQEPLNAALWAERLDLHPRWNLMNPILDLPMRRLPWSPAQITEAIADPAIIHFIGPYKPWHYRLRHPYSERYFAHLRQTPWRAREVEGRTLRNSALRSLPARRALQYEAAEYALKRGARRAPGRISQALRRALATDPRLYAWARAAYRTVRADVARPVLSDLLGALADARPGACFIQIGANDAAHNDPLRPYVESHRWRGVLVEPVPYVFERLRNRYGENPRIALVNAAVATEDGEMPFYYLPQSDDPSLPEWYDQIGSFVRENVLHPYHQEQIPGLAERIVCAPVRCLTFASLWRAHPLPRLDLVHIDAEGYDDQILAQIDLAQLRPTMILYEHKHLDQVRRRAVRERLAGAGYRWLDLGDDALAVGPGAPLLVRLAVWRHRAVVL